MKPFDPIELELFKNLFISISEEIPVAGMRFTMRNSNSESGFIPYAVCFSVLDFVISSFPQITRAIESILS